LPAPFTHLSRLVLVTAVLAAAGSAYGVPVLPLDYRSTYMHYTSSERGDIAQIRDMYADERVLAGVRDGAIPPGARIVMEIHAAATDDEDRMLLDEQGRMIRDHLAAIAVMERTVAGDPASSGWRFSLYSDEGYLRRDVRTAECAACHRPLQDKHGIFTFEALKKAAAQSPAPE